MRGGAGAGDGPSTVNVPASASHVSTSLIYNDLRNWSSVSNVIRDSLEVYYFTNTFFYNIQIIKNLFWYYTVSLFLKNFFYIKNLWRYLIYSLVTGFILGRIDRPREVSWYRDMLVLSQPNYRYRLYHRYMSNRQLSNEHGEPVQQVSQESGSRTQVTIRIRLSIWLDQ